VEVHPKPARTVVLHHLAIEERAMRGKPPHGKGRPAK